MSSANRRTEATANCRTRQEIAMIKRVYIDNFKSLVNFELQLQELTLLVGPNGLGKTSVLDVVFALRQLLAGIAKVTDAGIFPTSTLTRWQKRTVQVIRTRRGPRRE
jgi:predicted ATPase